MKNREQYKRLVKFINSSMLLLVQTAIYAYVWYRCYAYTEAMKDPFFQNGNYVVIALYALMVFFFFKLYGGFKVGYLRVFDVLYSQVLSVICANGVTYLQLCLIGHWKFGSFILPMLQMTVVELVFVLLWLAFSRWAYMKLYPPRDLLLIYGRYSPDNLARKVGSRSDKYSIQEMICYEDMSEEMLEEHILRYHGVILTDIPAKTRNDVLKFCFAHDIRCYTVPKISDIMIQSANEIHLFDTPLLLFRNKGLSIEQQILKRCFDILASLIALVIASPFMLVIAICIKAYDGGPVFFTQDRLTKNGRVFKVYKFRSMRVEKNDGEYRMTRKIDDRVTPVGKVIRNIHFDELPQLLNILLGDMSLVGPRPESPQLAKEYCEFMPEFAFRLKVKAGLTGYAQVYGKYNTTPYDKLKLDLAYIERYSFLLDLKLILMTVKVLFQKENTEGIEAWQNSAATEDNLEMTGVK